MCTLPFRPLCLCLLLHFLFLNMYVPEALQAEEHQLVPSIKIRTTYDDNVFFDDVSDFELKALPQLTYRIVHETGNLELQAGADINRYLEETQYDRVNQLYSLGTEQELTPRLTAGIQTRFAVDHTFDTELEEFGLETNKNRRNRLSAEPYFAWALDPRHTLKLNLRWNRVDYRQSSEPDNRDYDSFGLGLTLLRQWTERLFWVGQVSAELTDLDDKVFTATAAGGESIEVGSFDERQYSFQALAGINYNLSEDLSMSVRVGGGRAEFDLERRVLQFAGPDIVGSRTIDIDNGEWEYLFQARLDWQQEFMHIALEGMREIVPKFDGENVNRTSFRTTINYNLGARFILEARGSYVQSQSVKNKDNQFGNEVDSQSYAFSPGLRYTLSPDASLACHYEYRAIDDDVDDDFKDRHRVWFEFLYRWPMVF